MLRTFIGWVQGWVTTLDIKFNDPELYRALTQPLDGTDFVEVGPPGEPHE